MAAACRVGSVEEERGLELLEVYVADVAASAANTLVKVLGRLLRQSEIAHLKRIRHERYPANAPAARTGARETTEAAPAAARLDVTLVVQVQQPRITALLCTADTPPDARSSELAEALRPFGLQLVGSSTHGRRSGLSPALRTRSTPVTPRVTTGGAPGTNGRGSSTARNAYALGPGRGQSSGHGGGGLGLGTKNKKTYQRNRTNYFEFCIGD
ncbi:hypothetical protein T492DRAFT_835974 [Pavlovales sp. CCMP2436]|nr:hypothetical protein T492DRAFT_835974 [Pavlovales sp. CCMP2436]